MSAEHPGPGPKQGSVEDLEAMYALPSVEDHQRNTSREGQTVETPEIPTAETAAPGSTESAVGRLQSHERDTQIEALLAQVNRLGEIVTRLVETLGANTAATAASDLGTTTETIPSSAETNNKPLISRAERFKAEKEARDERRAKLPAEFQPTTKEDSEIALRVAERRYAKFLAARDRTERLARADELRRREAAIAAREQAVTERETEDRSTNEETIPQNPEVTRYQLERIEAGKNAKDRRAQRHVRAQLRRSEAWGDLKEAGQDRLNTLKSTARRGLRRLGHLATAPFRAARQAAAGAGRFVRETGQAVKANVQETHFYNLEYNRQKAESKAKDKAEKTARYANKINRPELIK